VRITPAKQKNVWGSQATGLTLEPQRSDLWMVDMDAAVNALNASWSAIYPSNANLLEPLLPQFVTSVTFPNFAVKPEVYRRSSIPYNMPGFDEPIEPVKITFLLNQDNRGVSPVYEFVTRWQALTRLGRGSRILEGPLDNDVYPDAETEALPIFRFSFEIVHLRGAQLQTQNVGAELARLNESVKQAVITRRRIQDALKLGNVRSDFFTASSAISSSSTRLVESTGFLERACTFVVQNAWIGSFKLSDLAYKQTELVTLEATFYPETVHVTRGGDTDPIP
jgi:hypothetical protein